MSLKMTFLSVNILYILKVNLQRNKKKNPILCLCFCKYNTETQCKTAFFQAKVNDFFTRYHFHVKASTNVAKRMELNSHKHHFCEDTSVNCDRYNCGLKLTPPRITKGVYFTVFLTYPVYSKHPFKDNWDINIRTLTKPKICWVFKMIIATPGQRCVAQRIESSWLRQQSACSCHVCNKLYS